MLPYASHKAGMDNVDREEVNKVIARHTSGKYQQYQKQREKGMEDKLNEIKNKLQTLTHRELEESHNNVDMILTELKTKQDYLHLYVHVDMDAFFANVEMRDDPRLRSVPMAVGGNSMLSTANYIARKTGVRSAMPGFIAKELCPNLVIVSGNYDKYKKVSREVKSVLQEYDSNMYSLGLDEACLEITQYMKTRTEPRTWCFRQYSGECECRLPRQREDLTSIGTVTSEEKEICEKCNKEKVVTVSEVTFGVTVEYVINEMRLRVEQKTGLTCSAGIACNYKLAKICSDLNKPNGQYLLKSDQDTVDDFVNKLCVRKVPGIGPTTEFLLKGLEIFTCKDLHDKANIIPLLFQPATASFLLRCAVGVWGCEDEGEESSEGRKSMSEETTFQSTNNQAVLLSKLQELCASLLPDVLKYYKGCHNIGVIVKYDSFERVTRQKTVDVTVDNVEIFTKLVLELFLKNWDKQRKIRLLGVRCSHFVDSSENRQSTLFGYFQKPSSTSDSEDIEVISVVPKANKEVRQEKRAKEPKGKTQKRPSKPMNTIDTFLKRRRHDPDEIVLLDD
ncbi:unnamed protein product [Bursaphelenchus okinawaensis]|uniref:DNA polymerase kappa n=1 Tax=Bursaphelenchus okinawaensis TaxID=465554 RepID=A0A811KK67_9BILA|nr:unnamed protein product [Bursaphelenchus okinawaensis]CAG9104940.1 unnamed protein product [Bursaphelenchus okinawaensis]